MGGNRTNISWTDESYQITEGCQHSGTPACDFCYAEEFAGRFAEPGQPWHGLVQIRPNGRARWTGVFRERPDRLAKMIGWRGQKRLDRPTRVFIGSMTDTFHEQVTDRYLAAAFAVFAALDGCYTVQLLTKRTARARRFFDWLRVESGGEQGRRTALLLGAAADMLGTTAEVKIADRLRALHGSTSMGPWPLRNVHMGVTVENNEAARLRVDDLVACDAAVTWLSMEPLFEGVDLRKWAGKLHWIVAGLESGHMARPGAIEDLFIQKGMAELIGAAFFNKQVGTRPTWGGKPYKVKHPHGSQMGEWPAELRVQRYPEEVARGA